MVAKNYNLITRKLPPYYQTRTDNYEIIRKQIVNPNWKEKKMKFTAKPKLNKGKIMKAVEGIAKERTQNSMYNFTCPHCNRPTTASPGKSLCPYCRKEINLYLRWK